jgi:phosphohistidine phosphatase
MRLYLVQHGEAKPKDVDPERRLTEKGRRDAEKVAAFLKPLGLAVTAVWQSGKPRARETAEILAGALDAKEGVVERSGLAPNDPVAPVAEEIVGAAEDTMIVGHMPFLGNLAALLVAGEEPTGVVVFRNGGVVCLVRSDERGWGVLWVLTPDVVP